MNDIESLNRVIQRLILACALVISGSAGIAKGQVAVTTHHNDTSRTGQNLNESVLNISNVNVNAFGKLFSRTVDGQIYAQPLYVPNLSVAGQIRNVVYVATQNDTVYAFDADDPNASSPLWHVNFGTPVPSTDVAPDCADITPQVGITSTPVIDTNSSTIYVVAKTKNTSDDSYHFKIHALDLITGTEKFGGPTEIAAQVPGTGVDNVGGTVIFDSLQQFNRPGLLLLNGIVYVAFGSACETPPWHGWIIGYGASTLQQVAVLNTTPNGSDGGIWGGGQGLLADSVNNIYAMTGNGTFDPTPGGDYGDSILKISTASGLSIVDYFTPTNQADLDAADLDLGSGGPMALPGTNLIVGSGKDGVVRVLDTTNLGQFSATTNNNVQDFQGTTGFVFMGAPIYWNSPNHGPVIYIWSGNDFLKAYQLVNGKFVTTPVSQSTVLEAAGYSNSVPLSLSANGNQAGTGIVWAAGALSSNANQQTVAGLLRAFDATDLTNELWDSRQNAVRDDVGNYAKFSPPTIANGKVYLATFSNQMMVYGLLGPPNPVPTLSTISPTSGTTNGGTAVTITGTGFLSGATVTLGGAAATNVAVENSTSITATTPVHVAGAVNVAVTNTDSQSGTLTNGYTYTNSGGGGGSIGFVQVNAATPQSPSASVAVSYSLAQTAGNLNIVVVGWNDNTSSLSSVSDSRGNSYVQAGTTIAGTGIQQAIYYAKNIAAGSNTVTVSFNQAAAYVDVRLLEYSGLNTTNPLDATAGAAGTSNSPDSGAATTTSANELIFGAGTTGGSFNEAGTGFTVCIITSPDGDIGEHKLVSSTGSYSAPATLNNSSTWVMQMVTFRASGQGSTNPAPTVTSISPNTGTANGGMPVTITGTGFLAGATVSLGGTAATNVAVANSTSITATTAAHAAGAVNVVVTNTDAQSGTLSNGYTYTAINPAPTVTGIAPSSGPASGGTGVTITGTGFQSGATVSLGGTAASNVVVGSSASITAMTPAHAAGAVNVVITNSDAKSGTLPNGYTYIGPADFTMTASALSPTTVAVGGTATSTISITPLNGFDGTLSLSCSSIVPVVTAPPTCAFAPNSVTGSGTSTLTVRTTAAAQGSLAPRSRGVFYAMWLPVGGLLVLGAGLTSRKQRFLCFLFECVLFSGLILLAACGGGNSPSGGGIAGTPAGVYTVTVSASGSMTHTTAVTLTVR